MGASSPFVLSRKFDVCIIDEAAQISVPAVLGPIMRANQFVLVGDPQQLRPLIQSKEASALGMAESLFEKLTPRNGIIDQLLAKAYTAQEEPLGVDEQMVKSMCIS